MSCPCRGNIYSCLRRMNKSHIAIVIIPVLLLLTPTLAFAHHMDFTQSEECKDMDTVAGYWLDDVCHHDGIPIAKQHAVATTSFKYHPTKEGETCEVVGRI